ncbi:hypothetical protein JL720_10202 [Aureococcus anophagefferens]|nr:hypothetical protein JL720_10202 [Aureococcus anophagefferens]
MRVEAEAEIARAEAELAETARVEAEAEAARAEATDVLHPTSTSSESGKASHHSAFSGPELPSAVASALRHHRAPEPQAYGGDATRAAASALEPPPGTEPAEPRPSRRRPNRSPTGAGGGARRRARACTGSEANRNGARARRGGDGYDDDFFEADAQSDATDVVPASAEPTPREPPPRPRPWTSQATFGASPRYGGGGFDEPVTPQEPDDARPAPSPRATFERSPRSESSPRYDEDSWHSRVAAAPPASRTPSPRPGATTESPRYDLDAFDETPLEEHRAAEQPAEEPGGQRARTTRAMPKGSRGGGASAGAAAPGARQSRREAAAPEPQLTAREPEVGRPGTSRRGLLRSRKTRPLPIRAATAPEPEIAAARARAGGPAPAPPAAPGPRRRRRSPHAHPEARGAGT